MKTKIIMTVLGVVALMAAALTVTLVSFGAKDKVVTGGDPYSGKQVNDEKRMERLQKVENEKRQFAEEMSKDPDKYEAERLTDEEIEALGEKILRAEEEAAVILQHFNDALSVVDRRNPGMFKSRIDSLMEVDRDVLQSFVYTLKNALLSGSESKLLKGCLAEKALIINEDDPLFGEIMSLPGVQ